MSKPTQIVCISGVDGSGKSMLVDALREHAEAQGQRVEVRWLRFNHFYTRPLLLLGRLLGWTRYQVVDGHRIGKHHFGRPRVLAKLFECLQFWDARRAARRFLNERSLQGVDLLILDRFSLDILADISVATDRPEFLDSSMARRIDALLPSRALQIGVQRDEAALLACRPESAVDPSFAVRLRAYAQLFQRDRVHLLKNNGTRDELLRKALSLMEG